MCWTYIILYAALHVYLQYLASAVQPGLWVWRDNLHQRPTDIHQWWTKNEKKSVFRKAGLLKLMSRESYQHLHQETILTLHSFNLSLCWRKATAWRSARQVPLAPLWIRQTSFARTNLQLHMSKHAGWVGLSSLCVTCCNRTQKKTQLASFSTSRSGKA